MAELMIDIYEYLTYDQIKELYKEEVRRQIRKQFANNREQYRSRKCVKPSRSLSFATCRTKYMRWRARSFTNEFSGRRAKNDGNA